MFRRKKGKKKDDDFDPFKELIDGPSSVNETNKEITKTNKEVPRVIKAEDVLPPPPGFKQSIPSNVNSPSLSSKPVQKSSPSDEIVDASLLNELKRKGFTESLRKIDKKDLDKKKIRDKKETVRDYRKMLKKVDQETIKRLQEEINQTDEVREKYRKEAEIYLEAGLKQIELGFYHRAVIDLACAILCVFIGEGTLKATYLSRELKPKLPQKALESPFFEGTELLLKSTLIKSNSKMEEAIQLFNNERNELFYKEDKKLIVRAIRHAQKLIKRDLIDDLLKISREEFDI